MEDLKGKFKVNLNAHFLKIKMKAQSLMSKVRKRNPKKVFDKISSIVNKEIRSNHILLIGRKELIFENIKRLIEVSALINEGIFQVMIQLTQVKSFKQK